MKQTDDFERYRVVDGELRVVFKAIVDQMRPVRWQSKGVVVVARDLASLFAIGRAVVVVIVR